MKDKGLVRSFLVGLATFVLCNLPGPAGGAGADAAPTQAQRPAPPGARYFEENNPSVSWSGSWSTNRLAANSGGSARLAMDAGAQASFAFAGTGVSWIGYRDEWCGIAEVSVDGRLLATVDTYATPAKARATLYTVTGLGGGSHTLSIQTTGTHNAASRGSWVWVDAFSVAPTAASAPSPDFIPSRSFPPSAVRAARASRTERPQEATRLLEQDDPAVTWSGPWSVNHLAAHHGGSASLAMEASSRVSLKFTGTGASWIGYRDEWSGIADVLLDGRLVATVDTYSTPARAQTAVYAIEGLREGTHTLAIQPTGRRHEASGGSWIWVDAFSITR